MIADTIGTLPLIGAIDTERARVILETVPENCVAKRITNLVIDLSGVPIVDTMVAQRIVHAVENVISPRHQNSIFRHSA